MHILSTWVIEAGKVRHQARRGRRRASNDLTGQRFGRLLVVGRTANRPGRGAGFVCWICRCDCGETTAVTTQAFRNGQRSCGCYRRSRMAERNRSGETWRARRAS